MSVFAYIEFLRPFTGVTGAINDQIKHIAFI